MNKRAPRPGGKADRRDKRNQQRPVQDMQFVAPRVQASKKPIEPMNGAQAAYMNAIDVYDIIFSTGPWGTGKTYIAACMAARAFQAKEIERIIITRPAVGAEEEYGFFPGTLEEKVAPWAKPVVEILIERLGASNVEYLIECGKIEIAPLGMLRGRTFANCWVIFDEAQNCTPNQMKLFLGRFGEGAKYIIDGDFDQIDLPPGARSGLEDGLEKMLGHPQVGHVNFEIDDIVRSGLSRDICIRYSQAKGNSVGHAELGRLLARTTH